MEQNNQSNNRSVIVLAFAGMTKPKNGYHIRTRNMVFDLSKIYEEVSVYQLGYDDSETIENSILITTLQAYPQKKAASKNKLIGFGILSEIRFQIQSLIKLWPYRTHFESVDIIYIEGCLLILPFFFLRIFCKNIVVDTHCINEDTANKMIGVRPLEGYVRKIFWHIIEINILGRANEIITISAEDKKFAMDHFHIPADKIRIIPHRVDDAAFIKFEPQAIALKRSINASNKKIIIFIGDLRAIHNKEAEEFIRNELSLQLTDCLFLIIGNNYNNLKDTDNVHYTGFVEEVDPYIIMADICITPLSFGSGIKTKMLDYMKYNKTIVTTPVGSEGIDVSVYKSIVVAERKNMAVEIICLIKS